VTAGVPRVEYAAPGETEPVRLTRRRTVLDVVFVNGEPYMIHLHRSRKTGRPFLRTTPLFGFSEEVVKYVREKIKECPWLHTSGEEYWRIVREHGMPPTALCIKAIMEGRTFPKKERKRVTKTNLIIAQLLAAAAEREAERRELARPRAPAATPPPAAPGVEELLRLWRGERGGEARRTVEELLRLWKGGK
jgi:hypothetical protein